MTAIAGRVVTPTGVVRGWVTVSDGRIADIAGGAAPAAAAGDKRWTIVPGFVDLHVHGGGGHSYTSGDPGEILGGVDFHLAHGTTTTLLSLVTAPLGEMEAACRSIAAFLVAAEPALRRRIVGVHAEGPFLSTARCGAQDPSFMIDPDPQSIDSLLAAAAGTLRMMTVAPERPGAIAAIGHMTAAGVIAAVGHSDATFEETGTAIAAGATMATHLGNAMSPLHHRHPGVVGACLAAEQVVCELIVDGHHLHPSFVRLAATGKGSDGVVLVTDAMAAAGVGDGRFRLGRLEVDVRDGVATVPATGSLAGSTLTMAAAYRNAVAAGFDEVSASRAASSSPARLLGLADEVGSIEVGKRADLVVLGEDGAVVAVLTDGAVVAGDLG